MGPVEELLQTHLGEERCACGNGCDHARLGPRIEPENVFHASAVGSMSASAPSLNRVLGPECGVRQEDNFQLRVVVRNSDGRTVTATKQTALCNSLN